MSADFNAGSIEGTLDLNTAPFFAGLRRAREQAARFEKEDIDPNLGLNTKEFEAKKSRVRSDLARLDKETAKPEVELKGVAQTLTGLAMIRAAIRRTAGGTGLSNFGKGVLPSILPMIGKISLLVGGVMTLTAALGPLTSAMLLFGAVGVTAMSGLILPLGLFIAGIKGAVKELQDANKAGKTLDGWAGKAQKSMKAMSAEWKKFGQAIEPARMRFLATVFDGLTKQMHKFIPLTKTVTNGMTQVVKSIFAVMDEKRFGSFLREVKKFTKDFTGGLSKVLPDLMNSFMNAFHVLTPLISTFGQAIVKGADALRQWTKPGHGLSSWVQSTLKWLPALHRLWTAFWGAVMHLMHAIAPLTGPAINFLTALFEAIERIDFTPIVGGLSGLLKALTWILQFQGAGSVIMGLAAAFLALRAAVNLSNLAVSMGIGEFKGLSNIKFAGIAAGIGLIGAATTSSSKSFSVLGSAAGGALLGFQVGGPIGAAIGAGAGALLGLFTASQKAKGALQSSIPTVDALAASLRGVRGAASDAARALVLTSLGPKGVKTGKAIGLTVSQMTNTGLGDPRATAATDAAVSAKLADLKAKLKAAQTDYENETARQLKAGKTDDVALMAKSKALKEAASNYKNLSGELSVFSEKLGLATKNTEAARAKIWANVQLTDEYTKALKLVPPAVRTQIEALGVAPSMTQMAAWTKQVHMSDEQARAFARGLGFTKAGVAELIAEIHKTPPTKNTKYTDNAPEAKNRAEALQRFINSMHGKDIILNVIKRTNNVTSGVAGAVKGLLPSTGGLVLRRALGGPVVGPGTNISDSIPAMLSNNEFVMRSAAVTKYGRGFLHRLNSLEMPTANQRDLRRPDGSASSNRPDPATQQMVALLRTIAERVGIDHEALADLLGKVSEAQTRKMIQLARSS